MFFNGVDRADRAIADWTVAFKTKRWYVLLFFRAIDIAVHNIFVILTFWTGPEQRDERYADVYTDYETGKHTHGVRMAFQLRLAKSLIEYAERQAIIGAGGDRSSVRWLSRRGAASGHVFQSPPGKRGPKFTHNMVPLAKGSRGVRCDACLVIAQEHVDGKANVTKLRSRADVWLCKACNTHLCRYCRDNNWDHYKKTVKAGVRLPPDKRGKLQETLEELEDNRPLA